MVKHIFNHLIKGSLFEANERRNDDEDDVALGYVDNDEVDEIDNDEINEDEIYLDESDKEEYEDVEQKKKGNERST